VDLPEPCLTVQPDGLELERIPSRGDHHERNRGSIGPGMKILRLQPRAQAGIVNFGLVPPETGAQSALNLQMIELQLDDQNVSRKIAANIGSTDVESSETATLGLCFYHHTSLLFSAG
jgi:hypothetical protein